MIDWCGEIVSCGALWLSRSMTYTRVSQGLHAIFRVHSSVPEPSPTCSGHLPTYNVYVFFGWDHTLYPKLPPVLSSPAASFHDHPSMLAREYFGFKEDYVPILGRNELWGHALSSQFVPQFYVRQVTARLTPHNKLIPPRLYTVDEGANQRITQPSRICKQRRTAQIPLSLLEHLVARRVLHLLI